MSYVIPNAHNENYNNRSEVKLVATNLPENKSLCARVGVSDNSVRLRAYAKTCGISNPEIVPATSVGLKWLRGGEDVVSDNFRKSMFCVLVPSA